MVVVGRYILSQRISKWGDSRSMNLAVGVMVNTDTTFRTKTKVKVIVEDLERVKAPWCSG